MRPRIALLSIIGLACLAALWWAGILELILSADRVHAAPIIGIVVLLGLGFALTGRWEAVGNLMEMLPVVGLVLTGYGILIIYPQLLTEAPSNATRADTVMALAPNVIAGAGLLWLFVLRCVCK